MKYTTLLFTFFLLLRSINLSATHITSTHIDYQCLGNDQYLITVQIIQGCGMAWGTTAYFHLDNDCGYTNPPAQEAQMINQTVLYDNTCDPIMDTSCYGGLGAGYELVEYEAIVTLPPCDSWTISYSSCCLSYGSNLVSTSENIYVESIINSASDSCNSLAQLANYTRPSFCMGTPIEFSFMALDPDGDSLSYSLISAMTSPTSTVQYVGGYSGSVPVIGGTLDSYTGLFTLPNALGVGSYLVAVRIDEFDDGVLVGSQVVQTYFDIMNCGITDEVFPEDLSGMNHVTGGTQTGPYSADIDCGNSSICFEVYYSDTNSLDTFDLQVVGPSLGYITYSVLGGNSDTIQVCLHAPPSYTGLIEFYINASDNICPKNLNSYDHFFINTVATGIAGDDQTICLGDTANLFATDGDTFQWSVLSGTPMNPANFGCDTCAATWALPSDTTIYLVQATGGACGPVNDTMTVNVGTPFSVVMADSILGCDTLYTTPGFTISSPINYFWLYQDSILDADTSLANYLMPQGANWVFIGANYAGCEAMDSVFISNAMFNTQLSASKTILCTPDSITLVAGGVTGNYVNSSQPVMAGIEVASNTGSTWPAPYGNWYKNAKHQLLFTAQELDSLGLQPGVISEIGWEVIQVLGTTVYNDYSIGMKLTTTTNLNNWETGVQNVFTPQVVNITPGVNMHVLDTPFVWDGVSNLVVQICYDNLATAHTNNSVTPYSVESFLASKYYYSDGTLACPYTQSGLSSANRPITYFKNDGSYVDYYGWEVLWDANPPLLNHQQYNQTTYIDNSDWYAVTITDSIAQCDWRDSIYIEYNGGAQLEIVSNDTAICPGDSANLFALIDGVHPGGNSSFTWSSVNTQSVDNDSLSFELVVPEAVVLEMVNDTGCVFVDTIQLDLYQYMPSIWADDTITCAGDSLYIQSSMGASDPGGVSYVWLEDSSSILHYYNSIVHVLVDSTASFTVHMTDTITGCTVLEGIELNVYPEPSWPFIVGNDTINAFTTYNYSLIGGVGLDVTWSVQGGAINSAGNVSASITWGAVGQGQVQAVVTDTTGCHPDSVYVLPIVIGDVGIEEYANEFIIYPNPTNGEITIVTHKVGEELRLFDVSGRLLKRIVLSDLQNQLNLSYLAKGTYYLRSRTKTIKLLLN